MLKIEVIKFEAMDVITASVATPEVDAPVEKKCTCPTAEDLYNAPTYDDYYYCDKNGHPGCEAEEHHCPEFIA